MRTARVWRVLLGVEHTVIESVELIEEAGQEVLLAPGAPDSLAAVAVLAVPAAGAWVMTVGMAGRAGGHWIWARLAPIWKRRRRGCSAASTGWWSPPSRGRARVPGTPMPSRTPARGLPPPPRS